MVVDRHNSQFESDEEDEKCQNNNNHTKIKDKLERLVMMILLD